MKKVIEIKNLEYTYPDGTKALNGVDLEVSKGESVALIGPNGAGKSTLLLHLNGILNGNGSVKILVRNLIGKNIREIRNKVGVVFQDPDNQLFSPTVFDDVAFGPINMGCSQKMVKEKVKDALRQVKMEEYKDRCPHHLSFGEKKRISLATVLSMNPEILALDEPTSNLDPVSRRNMIRLFHELKLTKVIATHDMEMVSEVCKRAILLSQGRIVADGKVSEILTNEELLKNHGLEPPPLVRFLKQMGYKDIPLTLKEMIGRKEFIR